jgi:hypothetical protein
MGWSLRGQSEITWAVSVLSLVSMIRKVFTEIDDLKIRNLVTQLTDLSHKYFHIAQTFKQKILIYNSIVMDFLFLEKFVCLTDSHCSGPPHTSPLCLLGIQ